MLRRGDESMKLEIYLPTSNKRVNHNKSSSLPKILTLKLIAFSLTTLLLFLCGCKDIPDDTDVTDNSIPVVEAVDPFIQNQKLGRGINLGNGLDAPNEGDWGVTIKPEYFDLIKSVDFSSVRIPVRWSAHSELDHPYTIDPIFMERVTTVIDQALARELMVVVDVHHYQEIMTEPNENKEKLLHLWGQIGTQFKNHSLDLIFEVLNEPNNALTDSLWNDYLVAAIDTIRISNPHRTLIIGTANWGGVSKIDQLYIPPTDTNMIVTVHYYDPFHFTHQGAAWVQGSNAWLGTQWFLNHPDTTNVINDFNKVRDWANANNRPIYLGEFGAYKAADMDSRVRWTNYIARQAEKRLFSWSYWEFCSEFGIYSDETGLWNTGLLEALIPPE